MKAISRRYVEDLLDQREYHGDDDIREYDIQPGRDSACQDYRVIQVVDECDKHSDCRRGKSGEEGLIDHVDPLRAEACEHQAALDHSNEVEEREAPAARQDGSKA